MSAVVLICASLLMSDGEQQLSKALAELVDIMWGTAGSSTPSALFAKTCAKVQSHFTVIPVRRIAAAMGAAVNDAIITSTTIGCYRTSSFKTTGSNINTSTRTSTRTIRRSTSTVTSETITL